MLTAARRTCQSTNYRVIVVMMMIEQLKKIMIMIKRSESVLYDMMILVSLLTIVRDKDWLRQLRQDTDVHLKPAGN